MIKNCDKALRAGWYKELIYVSIEVLLYIQM